MSPREYKYTRLRLIILFSIPIVFSVLFFAVNLVNEHNDTGVLNLQALHSHVEELRGIANDAEVGSHGYILTGDDRYLAVLQAANSRMHSETHIDELQTEPDLAPQLNRIISLVGERIAAANTAVTLDKSSGTEASLAFIRSPSSYSLMNNVRNRALDLQKTIDNRITRRLAFDHRLTSWSFLCFLLGTLVMLVVMVGLYNAFISYIHSRDRAHAELRDLNADLEQRIENRTQELRSFNEELQQFAYVASHDLQEPLRTITSFAQLLSSRYTGKLDEDADEFIDYIVNSARRMTDLINGLLALVRLRKAGQPNTSIPIQQLVRESEAGLQALIHENNAVVEVGSLPSLVVDRVQFAQVFQNLISNAIKYRRDDRSPVIQISAHKDATHWVIAVKDNGRGFDPQFAERIFGLFQRLHGRDVEGTGMGLSITRRIVERHGGRIWAESMEGEGSTFFLGLPASLEAHTDPAEIATTASPH